jgi:bifunctional non-homologous end joining protein LigD
VKPELVGEVEFTEWTEDGQLRHPSFQGLREDKVPTAVIREEEVNVTPSNGATTSRSAAANASRSRSKSKSRIGETKPASRAAADGQASKRVAANGKARAAKKASTSPEEAVVCGVKISSPDRVVYPGYGVTKLDLARYYESVEEWVMPYIVRRPLTLVRCPEGQSRPCFYQKHISQTMPKAVHGVKIKEKGGTDVYVAVKNITGLVSLVQMGVLEFHPWPAREDKIERPDMLVFDLDPGADLEWKAVVQGAKDVRDCLEMLGLKSFLRTSGGKGLHVVAPLGRRNTWDELKEFARGVAETMERAAPDRYVVNMSKAKRKGKVFVDYLRNQRGATAVASYSTRARSGAPIATPLSWDELSVRLKPNQYTVENIHKRLSKGFKDPWKEFFKVKQFISREMMERVRG